ncbi:phosphonate ABC transporter substrate-binding protein [Paraburkholderia solisilvae]|uniref:Putative phosphite transport system-binding protein PtxB n=1 Tax=Paraburkholderia solisilvae TaxID=624376 RepID=A0A6J5ET47_9BURK|nr:phosphonate ABC transporter substrate-binding protein [Paraburkholderia solisilvae]CAB3768797.1 putative phosphite transport system-binding protein PtxB [Paraburkholderia solisilvae]
MKFLRSLIVGVAAFACVAAHAEDPSQDLSFGIISTDASSTLRQRWQPLIDDLNKKTGLHVKAFFATDYAGIIEGMRFNKVQIGYFGNASAMEAVDRSNGEVFVKTVNANGEGGYYSLLITNVNSPYKTLDDVFKNTKNLNLGWGDPNSTSGTLIPGYYLFAKRGVPVTPASFKTLLPSSHEANLLAVVNNKIDVATNNTMEVDRLQQQHPDKFAQVRVLWKSPLIPSDPLVWRKDLPQATKDKLRDFFINYAKTDPHEKEVMKNLTTFSGFVASSNAQLIPIRQVALFQQKQKLEADKNLSDAERKTQMAALDAQLNALNSEAAKQQ